jgi:hypothetical protein
MNTKNLLIIFFLFCTAAGYSQEITKAKNTVYLDVGLILDGKTVVVGVGLNYERMLNDNFSIRAGVNVGFVTTHILGDAVFSSGMGFPVTFNYMTNNKNKFEAGLGYGPRINFTYDNALEFVPAIKLGYRYQPDDSGLMFKAGLEFPSNIYISLLGAGYHFK